MPAALESCTFWFLYVATFLEPVYVEHCLVPCGVGCYLAVGMTSGEVAVLSWQLPAVWRDRGMWRGGASDGVLPQPQKMVCWGERDGMAVRHIAWQCSTPSVC